MLILSFFTYFGRYLLFIKGIFSKPEQLLVVHNECSDRRRFAQPIGLRVNHVHRQRRIEIFGKKLIPIKCSVDAQSFAGNGSMNAD